MFLGFCRYFPQALAMANSASTDSHKLILKLEREISEARDPRVRNRLLMNLHHARGMTITEIARLFAVGRETVSTWLKRYASGGVAELSGRPHTGRPPKLDAAQTELLRSRIVAGPLASDGGISRFRGEDIRTIILKEFKVRMCLNGVYALLHRMRLSWICPRPAHPKGDAAKQKEFVESTVPLLSGKRRWRTRAR